MEVIAKCIKGVYVGLLIDIKEEKYDFPIMRIGKTEFMVADVDVVPIIKAISLADNLEDISKMCKDTWRWAKIVRVIDNLKTAE